MRNMSTQSHQQRQQETNAIAQQEKKDISPEDGAEKVEANPEDESKP